MEWFIQGNVSERPRSDLGETFSKYRLHMYTCKIRKWTNLISIDYTVNFFFIFNPPSCFFIRKPSYLPSTYPLRDVANSHKVCRVSESSTQSMFETLRFHELRHQSMCMTSYVFTFHVNVIRASYFCKQESDSSLHPVNMVSERLYI